MAAGAIGTAKVSVVITSIEMIGGSASIVTKVKIAAAVIALIKSVPTRSAKGKTGRRRIARMIAIGPVRNDHRRTDRRSIGQLKIGFRAMPIR